MAALNLSAKAQRHLTPILAKFAPADRFGSVGASGITVEPEEMPVPWLAYLALTQIIESKDMGLGDKTRWQVPFRYDGVDALLAHQKFGVRLLLGDVQPGIDADRLAHEIVGKLRNIIDVLERDVLSDLANERLDEARVTVRNQSYRLRAAFTYFRDIARDLLAASEAVDTRETGDPKKDESLFVGVQSHLQRLEQGSFNSIASINAYFSWLEHVLVLMLAFEPIDPSQGALVEHIDGRWMNKFRLIVPAGDPDGDRIAGRLTEVAENYRNTYGHGGFDKADATLGIHVDGIGAVPASLTSIRRSPHFEMYPFGPGSFADVLAAFDEADAFLHSGQRRFAMRFVEAGLDVAFDEDSRKEYRAAMATDETFNEYIDRQSQLVDDHMNMDY